MPLSASTAIILNQKMISFFFISCLLAYTSSLSLNKKTKGLCTEIPLVCPTGMTISNAEVQAPTANGCGAENSNRFLMKISLTALKHFTPCCNDHDYCYGGKTSDNINYFRKNRLDCDNSMNECIKKKIDEMDTNFVKKTVWKGVALSMYQAVRNLGCKPFAEARIKSHCASK